MNRSIKKIAAIMLALLLILSLAGCGKKKTGLEGTWKSDGLGEYTFADDGTFRSNSMFGLVQIGVYTLDSEGVLQMFGIDLDQFETDGKTVAGEKNSQPDLLERHLAEITDEKILLSTFDTNTGNMYSIEYARFGKGVKTALAKNCGKNSISGKYTYSGGLDSFGYDFNEDGTFSYIGYDSGVQPYTMEDGIITLGNDGEFGTFLVEMNEDNIILFKAETGYLQGNQFYTCG